MNDTRKEILEALVELNPDNIEAFFNNGFEFFNRNIEDVQLMRVVGDILEYYGYTNHKLVFNGDYWYLVSAVDIPAPPRAILTELGSHVMRLDPNGNLDIEEAENVAILASRRPKSARSAF